MDNTFLPLIFRMRYINRWSLMFNTEQEDLMQHTAECAFLVHFLATIGNRCFEKQYDADKLAVCALFHDAPEVLTGDLPTPVKYYNDEMKTIYKQIEKSAADKLKNHLPQELRADYAAYLHASELTPGEKKLLKCADKLCAYIKCIYELNAGNKEFQHAYAAIGKEIGAIQSDELQYFLVHCLPAFSLTLDDLQGTL
ncbi:MAG: 5'-deoxynucleotidase [Christensenellaceae bacterium]|nr:5'-deoxynucleotidase [Christensenellaceae bacterium]